MNVSEKVSPIIGNDYTWITQKKKNPRKVNMPSIFHLIYSTSQIFNTSYNSLFYELLEIWNKVGERALYFLT